MFEPSAIFALASALAARSFLKGLGRPYLSTFSQCLDRNLPSAFGAFRARASLHFRFAFSLPAHNIPRCENSKAPKRPMPTPKARCDFASV
jgi:hypothetical protein